MKFQGEDSQICKFIEASRVPFKGGWFRVSWTAGILRLAQKKAIATDIRWVGVGSGEGSWPVVE